MYEIILGRKQEDLEKFGKQGTIFIAKHYIQMGREVSLANPVLLDVARPHVILICGKRGSGKSYTLSSIAEEMANLPEEVSKNIASLFFDTMGIFWTMKYPNYRDEELLAKWGYEPQGLGNKVIVFTPHGHFDKMKNLGIPVDKPFSIPTGELSGIEWCELIGISPLEEAGVALEKAVNKLRKDVEKFEVDDIISEIERSEFEEKVKKFLVNRLNVVKEWGLFRKEGTEIEEILQRGKISIIDLALYTQEVRGLSIKALVIGLLCKKILEKRILARRIEELALIERGYGYFRGFGERVKEQIPLVWIFIDEAHEFIPEKGETLASLPLIRIIREGRQPGISLVMATQQPGKINTDVITQCDLVISHNVTAKIDIEALNNIMQTYLTYTIGKYLSMLPKRRGAAIVLDDNQERVYPIQIKPKKSWHGGMEPSAISELESLRKKL